MTWQAVFTTPCLDLHQHHLKRVAHHPHPAARARVSHTAYKSNGARRWYLEKLVGSNRNIFRGFKGSFVISNDGCTSSKQSNVNVLPVPGIDYERIHYRHTQVAPTLGGHSA